MNKKKLLTVVSGLILSVFCAYAQMTDDQIIKYVKENVEAGKSKSEIGRELLAKGVPSSQITRLITSHSNVDGGLKASPSDKVATAAFKEDRLRVVQTLNTAIEEKEESKDSIWIFGHDIFSLKMLSFEPNENAATPADYVLGPGDEIFIDVWGINEASIKQKISPEGNINISQIGPVALSGLTIEQAGAKLRSLLSQKYALSGENSASQISISLGSLRTIQVNVLGEVMVPGTYRLSSLSTVFNALYRAGGITNVGSLRAIQLSRAGKIIEEVDLYKYIFYGEKAGNVAARRDCPRQQVFV